MVPDKTMEVRDVLLWDLEEPILDEEEYDQSQVTGKRPTTNAPTKASLYRPPRVD